MRTDQPQFYHVSFNGRMYYPTMNTNDEQKKLSLIDAIREANTKNAEARYARLAAL